jgi:general secretion pathway protein L
MQKRIIIYLYSAETFSASWIILDENLQIIQSVSQGDINNLTAAEDSDVYIVVPAHDVLLTQVTLPKLSHQKVLQALPFALEEQLIDDVTELHFATGPHQDGNFPVAVVSQKKMLDWLAICEQKNLSPRAFIPAMFLLPFIQQNWLVNISEECVVRTGEFSGFGCEKDNLDTLLDLRLEEEPNRDTIKIVRSHATEQQLLEKNAFDITSLSYINLLQGRFQPKVQSSKTKKIWLYAAYLAIACVVLAFFSDIVSYAALHHQNSKIESKINAIYKKQFPQATSIIAPRQRMEEKLRTLSGQASKNNLLAILSELGKSLKDMPGIHIQNLDFRERQLTLEVSAATSDNLDNFTRSLTSQGLTVKQQNAAIVGTQVKATLIIHAGAS